MACGLSHRMVLQLVDLPTLPEWQQVVVILVLTMALAILVRVGMGAWIKRSSRLTSTDLDRVVFEEAGPPLYLTVILSGVYLVVPYLGFPRRIEFFLEGALLTVILFVWARGGIRIVARSLVVLRDRGWEPEFAPVLKNLWTFIVLLGGLVLLLSVWEVDVTPFLAGAGIAGIIIGIAAQDSIGNFFAGISLNLDQTYQVGDMIQLEDGTRGTVTNISIRSTTLLTRDNYEVTVPNNYLNNTQVINESWPDRHRRIRLDVGVAYGSDLEAVERVLLRVANETDIIMNDPKTEVRFRSFDDSAIRAQLQCYISHPAQWGRARHNLVKAISKAFESEGIKIPFPQRELTFFESENEIRLDFDGQ